MKGLHKDSLRKVDNPHQWMIDDARMELIQQIKAEVERLKEENNNIRCDSNKAYCQGYGDAFVDLLTSLSTLESEKPTLQEQTVDLDDAINNWQGIEAFPEGCGITPLPKAMEIVDKTARHFYELGRQSKEQPVSEELETEALRSAGVLLSEHFEDEDDDAIRTTALRCWKGGFIAGAKWQAEKDARDMYMSDNLHFEKVYQLGRTDMREQLMKEAVEGEVCGRVHDHINVRFADGVCKFLEPKNISHIPADVSKFNVGDKVRIIIVKEEGK